MKAFITGGTGFIGSHLTDRLLINQNDEIRCLVRAEDKWLHDKDYVRISGDLHDLGALEKGMDQTDVVFHVAGVVKASSQARYDRVNVDATENILRIAMKSGVPKVVILSSLAACGPSFKHPLTEEDPLMPVSMYGESKKRMEERVREVADESISVTIVRPPAVYGPREEQIFQVFQMASWGLFPIIGDGESTQVSLIHVDDLVSGIIRASSEKEPGVKTYFITSECFYTWNEIFQTTREVMGKRLFAVRVSPRLVALAGNTMERSASFIGHYPVMNREKARELGMQWTCSADKAREELGFRQKVSLEEGLSHTIKWYKRYHWL